MSSLRQRTSREVSEGEKGISQTQTNYGNRAEGGAPVSEDEHLSPEFNQPPEVKDDGVYAKIKSLSQAAITGTTSFFFKHVVKVLRDVMTYVVRGGLGTLTFGMDQALSLFISATDFIPGLFLVGYLCRIFLWMLTLGMWIVYTALELLIYLPTKLLAVYILVLAVGSFFIPDYVTYVFSWMHWIAHSFLHLLKSYLF